MKKEMKKEMKKVLFVIGTRPEAIKVAPLIKELSKESCFDVKLCITGQHMDLVYPILDFFNIKIDYDLKVMKPNQNVLDVTVRVLLKLNEVLSIYKPDLIVVHGDTTTTFSAALSGFYNKIRVAHLEAGLRTGDLHSPWPEEGNRLLVSKISDYHFCPTVINKDNLLNEGISPEKIYVTGNTIVDALLYTIDKFDNDPELKKTIIEKVADLGYNISNRDFVLITAHRRENYGQGIKNICSAIKTLSDMYPNIDFVFPVHPNPNINNVVRNTLQSSKNVYLINALEYVEFVFLLNESQFVLTDSGGIQEEAVSINKPVIVLRDTTERKEGVDLGLIYLTGTSKQKILEAFSFILSEERPCKEFCNIYGNGDASKKIVELLSLNI